MTGAEGIPESVQVARQNWSDWRDVFEHVGPVRTNPLLADADRFKHFCKEYSVQRTIRHGTHNDFRLELAESPDFFAAIHDDSGQSLDKLEGALRTRFGTHDGRNSVRSALSKVAAFTRPERFVAWDRYAKAGANIALGRVASSRFDTYAQYLAAFDDVWNGRIGHQIREYVSIDGVQSEVESEERFLRRVLDMYLMRCGGRAVENDPRFLRRVRDMYLMKLGGHRL